MTAPIKSLQNYMNLRTDVPNPSINNSKNNSAKEYEFRNYGHSYTLLDNKENIFHFGVLSKDGKPSPKGCFELPSRSIQQQQKSRKRQFKVSEQPAIKKYKIENSAGKVIIGPNVDGKTTIRHFPNQ